MEKGAISEVMKMVDGDYGNQDGRITEDEWVHAMLEAYKFVSNDKLASECDYQLATLQRNQRDSWRSKFKHGASGDLVTAMRAAGVTHLLLVRHANAVTLQSASPHGLSHDWTSEDVMRSLTNRGQAQCVAAKTAWFGACPMRHTKICRWGLHLSPTRASRAHQPPASLLTSPPRFTTSIPLP